MNTKTVDMLSGPVAKGLLAMTLPIMVMNVSQSLFALGDMAVLRLFGHEASVGAVGACGALIPLFTALIIGIAAGANVVIARHLGAGEERRVHKATLSSLAIALALGLLLMGIGVVFGETFLRLSNCPESLLIPAATYFRLYCCSLPFLSLYTFGAAALRAEGDTKRPMLFLMLGCAAKLGLTVLLLWCKADPESSVALATVAANLISCLLALLALSKRKRLLRLPLSLKELDGDEIKDVLLQGIPAGIQSALYAFANVVITTAVNGFGADATLGVSIANQYDGILYQISLAPSLAAIPFVAQNVGSGRWDRVRRILWASVFITVAFGATLGGLSAFFSGELSSLLSTSPAAIAYSQQKMILVSSTYFICGINEVVGGVLKGMGRPFAPMVTSLLFLCLLRFLWVYAIFPLVPHLTFLYTVWPVGWSLSILSLAAVYLFAMKQEKRKALAKA